MTNQNNDKALQDFMSDSRELGRELAAGKDALPKWAIKVAQAAADGILSDVKDADGNDDIARAYLDLMKAASKKAVHEHTTGGIKANVSKARQIKHAAEKPTCDFVGNTMPKVIDTRKAMIEADEKVKPAYAAIVDAARAQLEQDDDLSDEQITSVIRKPEPADKTVAKELAAIEKKMGDLISGEKGVKFAEPDFVEAFEKVRECVNVLTLTARREAALKEALELGLISPDTTQIAEAA